MTYSTSFLTPHWRRCLVIGGAVVLLAACSGVIGPLPYQLYVLQPAATPAADYAADPNMQWQLIVAMPDAPASLDTARIALSQNTTTMDYFAGANWSDRAPVLLQSKLVEAFENSGKVKGVARTSAGLQTDYLLQPEIRNFEAQYAQPNAAPQIVVKVAFKLVKMPDREIAGGFIATKTVQAGENKLDSIVSAFDEAVGAVDKQAVDWVLHTQMTLAPEPPKPPRLHRVHKPHAAAPSAPIAVTPTTTPN